MSRSFNNNSGKKTFGVFSESLDAGEYIRNKKTRASFPIANKCKQSTKFRSESDYLLYNKSNYLSVYSCVNSVDKSELFINLFTQLDLTSVPVIQNFDNLNVPTSIVPTTLNNANFYPYLTYNIDPSGVLFGDTVCGIDNYTNFMVYTPPQNNS